MLEPKTMKNQKNFLPRDLAKFPVLDAFQPGEDPDGGGGGIVSPFDPINFTMIHDGGGGAEIHYTELHLDSKLDGGTKPIKDGDEAERVMLIMPLPAIGDTWTMAVKLGSTDLSDEIAITRIVGVYATLKADFAASMHYVDPADTFFTIAKSGKWETYLNINQPFEVVKLAHNDSQTFDAFSMSFLARSNH
jgi:hypothetical protein